MMPAIPSKNKMAFGQNMMDRFFRRVDNMCWDLMSGSIGFITPSGICTIELGDLSEDKTEAPNAQVSVNIMEDFSVPLPAFAQSVAIDQIQLGDMIFSSSSNKVVGWVVKKNDKSFKLMKQDGTRSDWVPPKTKMLGFDSGTMVLRSLINTLPGGAGGLQSMQSQLMPLMMMGAFGENGSGLDDMMPMLLMSQCGLGGTPDSGGLFGGGNLMQTMLMMKMFKGNGNGLEPPRNFFKG